MLMFKHVNKIKKKINSTRLVNGDSINFPLNVVEP